MYFLQSKMISICQQLHHMYTQVNVITTPPFLVSCFSAFSSVDEHLVTELVTNSRSTTCLLDPFSLMQSEKKFWKQLNLYRLPLT